MIERSDEGNSIYIGFATDSDVEYSGEIGDFDTPFHYIIQHSKLLSLRING